MPLIYRVFIEEEQEDQTKKWTSFDTEVISHNLYTRRGVAGGPGPADTKIYSELVAGREFVAITAHKRFHTEVSGNNLSAHALHLLLAAMQDKTKLKMTVELRRFAKAGAPPQTVASLQFVAQVASYVMPFDDYYEFNFQIIGGVDEREYDE
jgi:hypothetical protein